MFEIIDRIGEALGRVFGGLMILFLLLSFVIPPLAKIIKWVKERTDKHQKSNEKITEEKETHIRTEIAEAECDKVETKAEFHNTIDIDNDIDDEFDWIYPRIKQAQPQKQYGASSQKDKYTQKNKPENNAQLKKDDIPQLDNELTIEEKPKKPSYYKMADSNVQYLIDRGVRWLYHFTNADNIDSIIENGIIARSVQEYKQILGKYNDPNEAGSKYISVSIEWPNYKMFYKLRVDNPNTRFVVICISIQALIECQFKMFSTNASKQNGVSHVDDVSLLYYDSPSRKNLKHNKYPTDPQAELRILNQIPAKYIKAIYFENDIDKSQYCNNHKADQRLRVASILFRGREDYEAWR